MMMPKVMNNLVPHMIGNLVPWFYYFIRWFVCSRSPRHVWSCLTGRSTGRKYG